MDQPGSERRVEFFKQFQVDGAETIAWAGEEVAAGAGDLFDQSFGAEFGEVITEGI